VTTWPRDFICFFCDLSLIYLLRIDLNMHGSVDVNSVSYASMMLVVDYVT
jgi:hypothetical protein